MNKLIGYFNQLNPREKRLVLLSGAFVVFAIFYWGLWTPLNDALSRADKSLTNQSSLLTWVETNSARAIQLQRTAGKQGKFTGSLPQAVNQTASRVKIKVSRMQPQGDELQVWVDQAPFNDVLSWLQALEKLGVTIIDLDIAEAGAPGQVKIRRLKLGKV